MCWYCCKWEVLDVNHRVGCELLDLNIFATSWNVSGWHEQGEILLQGSIWNPQYFTLFLLHDGHDLSANVGDAASLDNTCNTVGRRVVFLWLTHPIESSFIFSPIQSLSSQTNVIFSYFCIIQALLIFNYIKHVMRLMLTPTNRTVEIKDLQL